MREAKIVSRSDKWFRTRAKMYGEDGRIEVDSNAIIYRGDDKRGLCGSVGLGPVQKRTGEI